MNAKEMGKQQVSRDEWDEALQAVQISKADLNRVVMNFLVTEGYVDAARKFSQEAGVAPGVNLEGITDRMEIRKAVQGGHVQEAIEKVNDLNPEILEHHPQLYFHLHQQHFIELVRDGNVQGALQFAQENLAPRGEEDSGFLEELERTVALLAFDDAEHSPVGDLMKVTQRQKTASQLNSAILSSQSMETQARLLYLVKLLMWSQEQLDAKATYPRLNDITSGELQSKPPKS